jgi:predicted TIM-barrel fold metal-dependent hydrolase
VSGIRTDWLASGEEAPLEPDLELIDPHHHLWDHPESRYLAEEFARDARGHRTRKSVFVECGSMYKQSGPESLRPVGETEFVDAVARQAEASAGTCAVATGIVGYADLLLGEGVDAVLEAHLAASPTRFRGVRHSAAWHPSRAIRESHSRPPPHMLTLTKFREGFARLRQYDLSFDAWLFHSQLEELVALARENPETRIILNHVGGPLGIGPYADRRSEVFAEWSRSIEALAQCENVVMKLGGLQMAISGFGWHHRARPPTSQELARAAAPYFRHCIEHFGPSRCMFESNFPVDKVSCSYTVLWNAFKIFSEAFSETERAALFSGTAQRVYRI